MKISTISRQNDKRKIIERLLAILAWIAIWWIASAIIGQEMILSSPVSVMKKVISFLPQKSFWQSIGFSLSNVLIGFLGGYLIGIILACFSYRFRGVDVFLHPFVVTIKAAPVASYIILLLLLFSSRHVSIIISFLMAFPIVYTNVLNGLRNVNQKLLEMADVYNVSLPKKVIYIYFSELLPFLITAFNLGLGMSWKAGIAAEVIGLPLGSIGEKLYQAKIFVDTTAVLAWTVVIIIISLCLEKLLLFLLQKISNTLERL